MSDYVLTPIERIGILLRELARARRAEKPARLSAMFLREAGLSLDVVKHYVPTIIQVLASGGATQYARAMRMAELLLDDAAMGESAGRSVKRWSLVLKHAL